MIRIGAPGVVTLKSPDFEPPLTGVRGVRVRYRWLYAAESDYYLGLTAYLRPPGFDGTKSVPRLYYSGADLGRERSGEWLDQVLGEHVAARPNPIYDVQFVTIHMPRADAVRPPIHGVVEIDVIALLR